MDTVRELLAYRLGLIHDGEMALADALGKMADAVSDQRLSSLLVRHRAETQDQVRRLDTIVERLELPPHSHRSGSIRGSIAEFEDFVSSGTHAPHVIDMHALDVALGTESLEMESYAAAMSWAELLLMEDVAKALGDSYEEEHAMGKALNLYGEETQDHLSASDLGLSPLWLMSKEELYRKAKEVGVPGRSGMSREQLVFALGGKRP